MCGVLFDLRPTTDQATACLVRRPLGVCPQHGSQLQLFSQDLGIRVAHHGPWIPPKCTLHAFL